MTDNDGEILEKISGIAKYLRVSDSWVKRRLPELRACGAIFEVRTGRPPRKELRAWKSVLIAWTVKKTSLGEKL